MELGNYARGRGRINIPGADMHERKGSETIETSFGTRNIITTSDATNDIGVDD
jgi:hypothetical protein